ncbi:zinc ribbon domain-containing protein [Oceanobacillus jordanicus]|uniref:Zinc ribbon domain-containing protein n=1 Tax=Oceanobacillus jordanicus TaxID=2867266 RepID=A0AAW5B4P0_9BACI|nr:zinc ribbon domain-containing protein [Oceanobacillus jordanicus]MCG3419341.1 zinc ribbon domain-containing protein [Oceanobacillus jordanicus]
MICPSCGQQTEEGKFCTNCGAPLPVENNAATQEPVNTDPTLEQESNVGEPSQPLASGQQQNQSQSNDFMETVKRETSQFGAFFVKLLKKPSEGQNVTSSQLISGIITIVIFSLLISLGSYIISSSIGSYFMRVSFVDSFLLPLIQFLVLFGVIAAISFAGVKIGGQSLSFTAVVAKTGAYSVPFLVLTVLGSLLALVGISLSGIFILVGLLGPILVVPTFILLEKPAPAFDRIYLLIGIYFVTLLASGYLLVNISSVLFGGMLSSFL